MIYECDSIQINYKDISMNTEVNIRFNQNETDYIVNLNSYLMQQELADIIGINPDTVAKWADQGAFPEHWLGDQPFYFRDEVFATLIPAYREFLQEGGAR